jgi:bifunctional non-homologous end joining protein LigD
VAGERVQVEVDGRRLSLSNLDKVLYPSVGLVKAEVVDYYSKVASALLPHVAGRPMTFTRWPDGVDGPSFFEKNAARHAPDWVRRVCLPAPGSGMGRTTIEYVVVDDRPTLVWAANLAALELHVPQWRVDEAGRVLDPDLLVLDLDPGPPATVVECCAVALLLRDALATDGLQTWAKTSGNKGLQLYAPVQETSTERASAYVKGLAQRLETTHPDLVVSRMTKTLRPGKVFVDWSQNNGAKTTVAAYSLRARATPTVSTPVTWSEVEVCETPDDLRFTADQVLDRLARHGDLLEGLLSPDRPMVPPVS